MKNKHIPIIFIATTIIVIILIIFNVILYEELLIDTTISNLIYKIRSNELDIFMKQITKFANTSTIIAFIIITIIILIKKVKNKKIAQLFLISITTNVILNQLMKFIVRRPRPINKLIEINGYSFPSGHAMISMMFYGFLIYLYYRLIKNEKLKIILITTHIILIILIGLSRIYLNVHYFSDVITGFLMSILHLFLIISIINKKNIIT